jgi:hypothetical protein
MAGAALKLQSWMDAEDAFRIDEPLGRIGEGLVYAGQAHGSEPARIRRYWPEPLLEEGPDGAAQVRDSAWRVAFQEGLARFRGLGEALEALDHPHIARVRDVVPGAGTAAWWTDPVGESLSAWLARGETPAPGSVRLLADELAAALEAAHDAGLLHRDLSPETISVGSGRVVLTDFSTDQRPLMRVVKSQQGLVRPHYSPIELYDGGLRDPVGPATDIYSASAVLYRLIVGEAPRVWSDRLVGDEVPLAERGLEGYPIPFLAAIDRGLSVRPEDRFASAGDWRAALGSIPEGASPLVPPPPAAEPEPVLLADELEGPSEAGIVPLTSDDDLVLPASDTAPPKRGALVRIASVLATALAAALVAAGALAWGERSEDQYAARDVIVRAAPARDAEILAREPRGTALHVKARPERADDVPWRRITDGPLAGGWVSGRNLLDEPPPSLDRGEPGSGPARIVRRASVRRIPAARGKEIAVVEPGDRVYRVGVVEGSWAEILLEEGGVGYVTVEAFPPADQPNAAPAASVAPTPVFPQIPAPTVVVQPAPVVITPAPAAPVAAPAPAPKPPVIEAKAPEPKPVAPARQIKAAPKLAPKPPVQAKAPAPAAAKPTVQARVTAPPVTIRAGSGGTGLSATCQTISNFTDDGPSQVVMCRDPATGSWVRQRATEPVRPTPMKVSAPVAPAPQRVAAAAPPRQTAPSRPPERVASAGWLSRPWEGDIADLFPRRALYNGVSGAVGLQCRVGRNGWMTDCAVVSETPRGFGFAGAALDLASDYRLQPYDTAGQPTTGRTFNFTIPFRADSEE